jgi:hypothetical protein
MRLAQILAIGALTLSAAQGCQAVRPEGKAVFDASGLQDEGGATEAGDSGNAACLGDGENCERDPCCGDLECLGLNGGPRTCHAACDDASDCGSGCCVSLSSPSRKVCGAEDICFPNGCEPEGQSCDVDIPCCGGLRCVVGALPSSRNGCRVRCEQPEDCASGCCTLFGEGDRGGFCDDALYCTCIEQGDDCSAEGRTCCDGSRCARFGEAPFSCLASCESDEDCGGNCCTSLRGSDKVCAPFPC